MYSLFGQNSQNFLQSHVVCVEIEQSENFGYFGQKSKYVSFNSRYSKIKSLYAHFEHFFFATFGLFTLKSGPHIWLVMCVGMGTCGFSAGLFMGVGMGTDSHTYTLQNEPQIIQNSQVLSEI